MLTVRALVALAIFLPLAQSQLVQSLPDCVQQCIDQSGDDNCSVSDIKCLCRASAGNFLPNLITCMHGDCDNSLDNNLLLTPLQYACEIVGTPIPDSAIQNAENVGSSLATQATATRTVVVTVSGGSAVTSGASASGASASGNGGGGKGGSEVTTTIQVPASPSITTVTTIATERDGSVIVVAYPVTEWLTTTLSGSGSTVASVSNGATIVSTYTTTDSKGHTTTQKITVTETTTPSSAAASSSSDGTTIVTTTAAAAKTSSSSTSKTKGAINPIETNSSPFQDEPSSAATANVDDWLGLIIFLVLGILWF